MEGRIHERDFEVGRVPAGSLGHRWTMPASAELGVRRFIRRKAGASGSPDGRDAWWPRWVDAAGEDWPGLGVHLPRRCGMLAEIRRLYSDVIEQVGWVVAAKATARASAVGILLPSVVVAVEIRLAGLRVTKVVQQSKARSSSRGPWLNAAGAADMARYGENVDAALDGNWETLIVARPDLAA